MYENILSDKGNILKQKNYYILPFSFNTENYNIEEILESINKDKWELVNKHGNHLFKYINNLINDNKVVNKKNKLNRGKIGVVLELKIDKVNCEDFGIRANNKGYKNLKYDKGNILFAYKFIRVYLFETGVGFLVYSIKFGHSQNQKIEDIINGNYYFKKFDQKSIREDFEFEVNKEKVSLDKIKEVALGISNSSKKSENNSKSKSFDKLIEEKKEIIEKLEKFNTERSTFVINILNDLGLEINTYFTRDDSPNYAHTFSYMNLESKIPEEEINKYVYWLKNSYKTSYKPTKDIISGKNNRGVKHLYENIWWGSSIEGVCCVAQNTENDNTTNNFLENYTKNIEDIYLSMYILMLHIRYALLLYIIEAAEYIPRDISKYTETDIRKINELKEKIIMLDLRCIFNDISNMSGQIAIFDLFRETLRIDKLTNELENEINNLNELASLYYSNKQRELREKEEAEKNKKYEEEQRENKEKLALEEEQNRKIQNITFIVSLFTFVSFAKDITAAVVNIEQLENKVYIIVAIIISAILILMLIRNLISKMKKR